MGLGSYLWITIVGGFATFYNAFGIGANDAANSFATSVGAKVLTIRQALVVAGIFEFLGALLMGSHVTDTIRKKIVDIDIYQNEPEALMFGMLCAELAAGTWLLIATYFRYPVSTTHSIIGAIIGFSLAYGGKNAVGWNKVGEIVLSWLISPLLAGIFALVAFSIVKRFIFKSRNPFGRTLLLFPILAFITLTINSFFIIYKGTPQLKLDETPLWVSIVSAFGIGIFAALVAQFIYIPYIKRKIERSNVHETIGDMELNDIEVLNSSISELRDQGDSNLYLTNISADENIKRLKGTITDIRAKKIAKKIDKLHSNADNIDEKTDKLYSSLQIITACFSSFAHGANDVANAIAPLAAIVVLYQTGEVGNKSDIPIWIILIGAAGIVCGLATWGYRIIDRIGKELTKITPSRGFLIELSAALTVIIASRVELPVSTTHCQVGSVIGCGLADGKKNIDWKVVRGILFSWLITLPITGLISAALFSYGYYAP